MSTDTTHNEKVRTWHEATTALAGSMDDLRGRRVRVQVPWHDEFVGTVTRVNRTPSSAFGKSLSVTPDDPRAAKCGSMSGIGPQNVTLLDETGDK